MDSLISNFTETVFLNFVTEIHNDEYATEDEHIKSVLEFEQLSEHPSGSDLLYYPEAGKSGPEAVVKEVNEWRAANGKPGFKSAQI